LIKKLDLDHPFIVGYSDGGQIALEIGIEFPDVPRALIAGGVLCEISEYYTNYLIEMGLIGPGNVDFNKLEEKAPQFPSLLSTLHSSVYGPDYWKELIINISKMWTNPDEFPGERVRKISVPTLIMHGDRDDGIPLEDPLRIYRMIPNGELSIIPNTDHKTFISQIDLVSKVILNFLNRYK
ncbi:MAG: alpha/beta fold hydrolase, partial [Promethearchaeota archaeon]